MVQAARGSGAKEYAKVWCCVCVCELGTSRKHKSICAVFFCSDSM